MKELNDKIRNGIADSYHLRNLAKNEKLTFKEKHNIYQQARENDKRILFYKKLNNALRKSEKNDIAVKSK